MKKTLSATAVRWALLAAGCVMAASVAASAGEAENPRCRQAKQQLEWIKARMRAGYRNREADALHRRELKAREARRKYCRG